MSTKPTITTIAAPAAPADRADPATDWPIARLRFDAASSAVEVVKTYTPGLPEGEHDVWCVPVARAEQPIGIMSRATYATSSGAGYKALTLYFEELHDAEQVRLWAQTCGTKARPAAPVAPAFAPSPECDSPRICSTAKVCAGLFGTKQQCGAPVAPAGMALVPLRMTQAMRDATDSEGWTWEDLLAAAEAITEDKYTELAAPVAPSRPAPRYTTRAGDSLGGIALRELNDSRRWVEIRDLNADRFPDMCGSDYYPVGTMLIMPAAPVAPARVTTPEAAALARILQSNIGGTRNFSGLDDDQKALWDRCQRVIDAPAAPAEPTGVFMDFASKPGEWTDAKLRGIASDYFDSAHWPAAMLCLRHLLMEQSKFGAPVAPAEPQTQAAVDVLAERRRQIEAEGWTPEHDDEHGDGSMSIAAACYALADRPALEVQTVKLNALWLWTGWAQSWFKPRDQRSNLVRAGALILAEIERLDRNGKGAAA